MSSRSNSLGGWKSQEEEPAKDEGGARKIDPKLVSRPRSSRSTSPSPAKLPYGKKHDGYHENQSSSDEERGVPSVDEYVETSDEEEDQPLDEYAANRAGFHPRQMEDFERFYFPEYEEYELDYLVVRNLSLLEWKRDPNRFLAWNALKEQLPERFHRDGERVYRFLMVHGYINSGQFASVEQKTEYMETSETRKRDIIVVGAGAAGIMAARQLMEFGFEVTILEANSRVGGRVHTSEKLGGIDLGASIVTGLVGNPLDDPYEQLELRGVKIRDPAALYDRVSGKMVPRTLDKAIGKMFHEALDATTAMRKQLEEDESLGAKLDSLLGIPPFAGNLGTLDWYIANLEYACATEMSQLSLLHWDDDSEFKGAHLKLADGYSSLLHPLSHPLSIKFDTIVTGIDYSSQSPRTVTIETQDGSNYICDAVIVTVPLGVLKDDWIQFSPPLPIEKQLAIDRLGFGLLNKIVLKFNNVFWNPVCDWIGTTNPPDPSLLENPDPLYVHRSKRGFAYIFWNMKRFAGQPVLVALCSGQAAYDIEKESNETVVKEACEILANIFKLPNVPVPSDSIVTRWSQEKFSRGSYSFVKVGASGADYDVMAEPIDHRVFFAGEATNRSYPATVAGAYQSGLREAARIYRTFVQEPQPLTQPIAFLPGVATVPRPRGRPKRAVPDPNTTPAKKGTKATSTSPDSVTYIARFPTRSSRRSERDGLSKRIGAVANSASPSRGAATTLRRGDSILWTSPDPEPEPSVAPAVSPTPPTQKVKKSGPRMHWRTRRAKEALLGKNASRELPFSTSSYPPQALPFSSSERLRESLFTSSGGPSPLHTPPPPAHSSMDVSSSHSTQIANGGNDSNGKMRTRYGGVSPFATLAYNLLRSDDEEEYEDHDDDQDESPRPAQRSKKSSAEKKKSLGEHHSSSTTTAASSSLLSSSSPSEAAPSTTSTTTTHTSRSGRQIRPLANPFALVPASTTSESVTKDHPAKPNLQSITTTAQNGKSSSNTVLHGGAQSSSSSSSSITTTIQNFGEKREIPPSNGTNGSPKLPHFQLLPHASISSEASNFEYALVQCILSEAVGYYGKGTFNERSQLKSLSQAIARDILPLDHGLKVSDSVKAAIEQRIREYLLVYFPSSLQD
jgi:lysine-specific histone demethylase 1